MSKIGHFDICKQMAIENLDIQMAPLDNVTDLRKVKAGTNVTIGVGGDMVAAIGLEHKYVGGLLLINREQYFAMKAKLEASETPDSVPSTDERFTRVVK